MSEIMDYRMQQQLMAQEFYRQQFLQRLPDPYNMPIHQSMPAAFKLSGIEATLQNEDLWQSFAKHGTEMIITKSGRRMFPSVRVNLSGLEDDATYCLMLEMVPIGDCRFKFSGSQWVPAGGAEPQSPQRMYLHPDSPALGSHWKSQAISFSKTKLTNNTFDSNGHIVLTSMHKYRPRLHVIRTSDPSQIPWSPSQVFCFPDTDFVAVTAYQNDQITKLKIDNNPFAKGFREQGQSRCKRKQSPSSQPSPVSSPELSCSSDESSVPLKRMRSSHSISSDSSICIDNSQQSSPCNSRTETPQVENNFTMMMMEPEETSRVDAFNFLHQQFMESIINYQELRQQLYSDSQLQFSRGLRPSWMDFALNFSKVGLQTSPEPPKLSHSLDAQLGLKLLWAS